MHGVATYLKRSTTFLKVSLNFRQCCIILLAFTLGYIYALLMSIGNESCLCNQEQYDMPLHKEEAYSTMVAKSHQKTADLIVIIFSGPHNRERRKAIRTTWLQTKGDRSIIHLFSIGSKDLTGKEAELLNAEQHQENDLLLLPTVKDSYMSLTAKLLATLGWLHKNASFKFMLKVDDDSFVRLDVLFSELMKKKPSELYWGFFDGRARVKTRGSWAESSWILCDRYLPYALGGGYIISEDLVVFVATNSQNLVLYNSEDVSLGTWLAPLHVQRIHDPRFDTEYRSRGCSNMYIISHKQTLEDIRDKYKNLIATGALCRNEVLLRRTYIYNWKVPPSRCCVRNISSIGHNMQNV